MPKSHVRTLIYRPVIPVDADYDTAAPLVGETERVAYHLTRDRLVAHSKADRRRKAMPGPWWTRCCARGRWRSACCTRRGTCRSSSITPNRWRPQPREAIPSAAGRNDPAFGRGRLACGSRSLPGAAAALSPVAGSGDDVRTVPALPRRPRVADRSGPLVPHRSGVQRARPGGVGGPVPHRSQGPAQAARALRAAGGDRRPSPPAWVCPAGNPASGNGSGPWSVG